MVRGPRDQRCVVSRRHLASGRRRAFRPALARPKIAAATHPPIDPTPYRAGPVRFDEPLLHAVGVHDGFRRARRGDGGTGNRGRVDARVAIAWTDAGEPSRTGSATARVAHPRPWARG